MFLKLNLIPLRKKSKYEAKCVPHTWLKMSSDPCKVCQQRSRYGSCEGNEIICPTECSECREKRICNQELDMKEMHREMRLEKSKQIYELERVKKDAVEEMRLMELKRDDMFKKAEIIKDLKKEKLKAEKDPIEQEKSTHVFPVTELANIDSEREAKMAEIKKEGCIKIAEKKRMIEEAKAKNEKEEAISVSQIRKDTFLIGAYHSSDVMQMIYKAQDDQKDPEEKKTYSKLTDARKKH